MPKIDRVDWRATLKTKAGASARAAVLGPNNSSNIMQPLYATGGVLFPFNPTMMVSSIADYDEYSFTHSNYKQHAFKSSSPGEISMTADFTAQTTDEAKYMLAVMFFFRSATKAYFGEQSTRGANSKAGLPPPVLRFNYMGSQLYNNVPVVITAFSHELPINVDYVPVIRKKDDITYVPTKISIATTLLVQQNPSNTRKTFDLDAFKQGKMIGRGFI